MQNTNRVAEAALPVLTMVGNDGPEAVDCDATPTPAETETTDVEGEDKVKDVMSTSSGVVDTC